MTKTILAIALASLVAMPAAAETWTLHDSGQWDVIYVGGDEPEQCIAGVSGEPLTFALTYDEYGFDGNVTDERANWGQGEASIDIWVDRRNYFTPPVSYDGDTFWFDITNRAFVEQLWQGRKLNIDYDRDGTADYWFSLEGSAAAIGAFIGCTERMGQSAPRPVGAPA